MMREDENMNQLYQKFENRIAKHLSDERMKRIPMSIASPASNNPDTRSPIPDLLWISRQQQQHPSTHAHPLKNTIRLNSNGVRYKFDGKQWRPLCESMDGGECRNLSFRSSLCQKHFYKIHLYKRPYGKNGTGHLPPPSPLSGVPSISLKRSLSSSYEHQYHYSRNEHDEIDDDEDSIQLLESHNSPMAKRDRMEPKIETQSELKIFTVDCDSQCDCHKQEINLSKSAPFSKIKRFNSINNESIVSHELENSFRNTSIPKLTESIRPGIPSLTRTEEKSIANELISQLSADASFAIAEQLARRRACEIMIDNYSHPVSSLNIIPEWFYDFLLRHPRVPIHFQTWFGSVKATMPSSDLLIDIKIWELGLITRSIMTSSSLSSTSSSP